MKNHLKIMIKSNQGFFLFYISPSNKNDDQNDDEEALYDEKT